MYCRNKEERSQRFRSLKLTLKPEFKKNGKIADVQIEKLTQKFPLIMNGLVKTQVYAGTSKSKVGMRYSDNIKKFASSLHFYSPKAYDFALEHLPLPHPNTITAWKASFDCGPGYISEVLERLGSARRSDSRNMMTDIVMQLDEMAIRKETPWDPKNHRFAGFVDDGSETYSEDAAVATNALVCLIAGISGGWKYPIGYAFTNKVDGKFMYDFVTKGLELLGNQGFNVHAVISDGFTANVTMFEKLGLKECDLVKNTTEKCLTPILYEDIQPLLGNVSVADQKTYAIFDIVHMMKLWRNFLFQCNGIQWDEGEFSWKYVESLYKLQNAESIVAGNRLTRNHLEFHKHKMNVKFAVQVLSSSVADAIDFCREDLTLEEFQGSKPTTDFIKLLDKAFDILNSGDPNLKGYKAPLKVTNFHSCTSFLEDFCKMILKFTYLETTTTRGKSKSVRKLVCRGNRKRCVLRFVVSIKSIISISYTLLYRSRSPFWYVCTYRFSQDLLELLFNQIRGRLGRNNNPNTIEFENIMKSLSHQNMLKSSNTGNCILQMTENEIPGGLLPLQRSKRKLELISDRELSLEQLSDVEYSQFYLNCLAYISGNIARVVGEKLSCSKCSEALLNSPSDKLDESVQLLISRKTRGGLLFPSQRLYKIVEITDFVYQSVVKGKMPPKSKNLDFVIVNTVFRECRGLDLFPSLKGHLRDFNLHADECQLTVLIRKLASHYIKIRFFDLGKKFKSSMAVSSRRIMTNQILFSNE
jgi:hypothetical protein